MTMKSLTARAILVAGMLVLGVVGPNAAIAAPPQPGGTAPLAKILLIDLRRVMSDSKVGQDMQQQIKALKAQATNELNGEGRALQGEKTQLEQQAAILAPDVKARRIKDFEARASAFQEKVQKRGGMI